MDENKKVHRIEIANITPQDIFTKNVLEKFIISRNYEKVSKVNKKAASSSKIL